MISVRRMVIPLFVVLKVKGLPIWWLVMASKLFSFR